MNARLSSLMMAVVTIVVGVFAPNAISQSASTPPAVTGKPAPRGPGLTVPLVPANARPDLRRGRRLLYPSRQGARAGGTSITRTTNANEPASPLLPEGYRIAGRTGGVGQEGIWWVFNGSGIRGEPPLTRLRLLPSRSLAQIEAAAKRPGSERAFVLSGLITEYRGRNYLLPSEAQLSRTPASRGQSVVTPKVRGAAAKPSGGPAAGPSRPVPAASAVLQQLAREQIAVPTPLPPPDTGGVPTSVSKNNPRRSNASLPDGTILIDRVVRLVRDDNWWILAFESGGDSPGPRPMRLLPSRLVETLEAASAGGTDHVSFIISGEVHSYRGARFILLRKVLIRRSLGNLQ